MSSYVLCAVECSMSTDRESGSNSLGIGGALYLHRFLYKTRKSIATSMPTPENDNAETDKRKQKALNAREAIFDMQKKIEDNQNAGYMGQTSGAWDTLKQRLASAKVEEALSSAKLYVNGKKLTILRPLGEGGYSMVYEVYDANKKLYALKVVNLAIQNDGVKQDLISEIVFLERLKQCDLVIKAYDYELRETEDEHKIFVLMERGDKDMFHILSEHRNKKTLSPTKLR